MPMIFNKMEEKAIFYSRKIWGYCSHWKPGHKILNNAENKQIRKWNKWHIKVLCELFFFS